MDFASIKGVLGVIAQFQLVRKYSPLGAQLTPFALVLNEGKHAKTLLLGCIAQERGVKPLVSAHFLENSSSLILGQTT